MSSQATAAEIRGELRQILSGRVGIADAIIPPLLFVAVNSIWGLIPAALAGLGSSAGIVLLRLAKGRRLRFALAGLFGTLIAVGLALRSGSADDYFLPGIISGAASALVTVASVFVGRPLVAWTSWLTRGWPLGWYWHPRVRPAYARASWLWAGFFAARALVQWGLFAAENTVWLGVARVAMGWPALLVLLIATYVLGRRWLEELDGPSVAEYLSDAQPPWVGQGRGF